MACLVRRLHAADAAAYRELRLEGLRAHPQSFAASWNQERARPLAWFEQRLTDGLVLGAWSGGADLVGIAGLHVPESPKLSHKGMLWGVYVRPQARGTGLAGELLGRVIEQARSTVEEVLLTVQASNAAALGLYRSAGFKEYGLERRALKIDGRYYDEVLMALPLSGA
jgi:ribosomal protein S18 acetylase RimI-like enzyme